MKKETDKQKKDGNIPLLLSIIIVFCIFGTVVFLVSNKISVEMSASAIQNLSESLDLIECTIEAVMNQEAEFQQLMAHEVALAQDPQAYIGTYRNNETMVKISLIYAGEADTLVCAGMGGRLMQRILAESMEKAGGLKERIA